MSNEELAVLIQKGNKEYIPELWDNVYRFIYKMCNKYYISHFGICVRAGVELEDITQTSYFALLKAIEAYKPEGKYKFTTYISYHLQMALDTLLGIRGNMGKRPLNYAVSLDKVMAADDDSFHATAKIDTTEDITATEAFDAVERRIYNSELREHINNALSKLPEKQTKAVKAIYFEGMTNTDYAKQERVTQQAISVRIRCAFNNLRKDMELKRRCEIYREWEADKIDHYGHRGGFRRWYYTGYSSTEKAAERIIQRSEKH